MNTKKFYDQNDQALRPVNIETRDNLGALAVQIVVANNDLTNYDPNDLVEKLYETIGELHHAYHKLNLPDNP